MKKSLLSLLCLCLSYALPAQNNDKWRAGSAKELRGKVYVLSIFIATPDNDWTKGEKFEMFSHQREAFAWLKEQASRYHESVEFQEGTFGYEETVFFPDLPTGEATGKEPVDWIGKALKKVGYATNMAFYDWVRQNTPCTEAIVLLYANRSGVSYALPYATDMPQTPYFNEGCVLFKHYDAGKKKPLCAALIAHELLHTFGAWDLYATYAQTADREQKARDIYPDDIMLRTSYQINELEIGALTAWLVGWRVEQKDWFNWFKPKGY